MKQINLKQQTTPKCLISYLNKKNFLNCMIFILTVAAIFLIKLLFDLHTNFRIATVSFKNGSHSNVTGKRLPVWRSGTYENYGFHPVNQKGVYSFWNVCIETQSFSVQKYMQHLDEKIYFNETKKIVVYDSFYRTGMQKLYVTGSHNSPWNHWDLYFTRESIPPTHKFLNTTAFFVAQTCPANFHHFWIDEFVPLFCVVKQANKLTTGAENQIIYRLPSNLTESSTKGCFNKTVFEEVLSSLYISSVHDVFYHMKANVCFSSAVFGISATISNPRAIVDHVLRHLNVNASYSYITIIQRTYRRIINARELAKAIRSTFSSRVRIVHLEKLSVREQAKVAASSRVMIGIQGAGLQWAVFMRPGSNLIEIAWPYKHWGFYFRNYVTQYQIAYHELYAQHVQPNWTSYEQIVRRGNIVSIEEKLQLLQSKPKTSSLDNIWKWADGFVNKDELIRILSTIDSSTWSTKSTR